jgi:enterochelin esterase-like enzyme
MSTAKDPYLLPWSGRVPQATAGSGSAPAPSYITSQGRDLRIDLLRGYFVLAMIVDHVRGMSPLYLLTGGNRFFVSAAEGFILTSGLLAGLIYRRIIARDGIVAAARKVWTRAFTLYLLTIGITLLLLPLSELGGLPWAQGVDLTQSVNLVVSVLTLHRTYYLIDVLLLYTVLFALTPVALLLMADGKTWLVLAASWALWGLHQFFPAEAAATWPIAGNHLFTFSAWQLLFFNGLALGYQRDRIPSLTLRGERRLQIAAGAGVLALIGLFVLLQMPATALPPQIAGFSATWQDAQLWIQQFIFGKADLRPGRLVAAAVVFTFLFVTLTLHWRQLRRPLEWLLTPLGENSLYAYTAHIVAVVAIAQALKPFGLATGSPWWLNMTIQIASVWLIWFSTRQRVLEPTPKTRSVWRASPAAVAILSVIVLPWLPASSTLASAASPTVTVSDAILARARAFGTPVVSVNLSQNTAKTNSASSLAAAQQPLLAQTSGQRVSATLTPQPAPATAGPVAAVEESAAAMAAAQLDGGCLPQPLGAAALVPDEALRPATTPQPTIKTAQPVVTPLPPAPAPAPAAKVAAAQPAAVPAQPVAAQPAQAQPAAAKSALAQPAINWATSGPPPALPPDSERLANPYVGALVGKAYERSFRSQLLNRDMAYWVYLPPGYGQESRRYPVLYMLHGGGGNLEEWAVYGLFDVADEAIRTGVIAPMIIVLPQGDVSYWTNWASNSPRWGDYLAYEVVYQIDAAFATVRSPAARAIGGLSMGAWGALHQAFVHPDIFGVAAAHSASFYPDDNNLKFLGVGAEFASKDPLALAGWLPGLDSLRIWIDLGQDDPWLEQATQLHNTLLARGIEHTWRVNAGRHAGEYWAEQIPTYLRFYSVALSGR